jgi:outer membrane protein OmpA-like peptidoglycan-associated protein
MKRGPRLLHAVGVWLLGLAVVPALHAQGQAPAQDVIPDRALTSGAVLEALDPTAVRTRSLRIGATGRPAVPARASASLLVTFDTNSSELTSAARRQLDIVASALRNDRLVEYRFTVEGHADPRGSADNNLRLSQERAESVKRYLVTAHGIAQDRLVAEGRGDREPMHPAQPAAPENRRVTFVTQAR